MVNDQHYEDKKDYDIDDDDDDDDDNNNNNNSFTHYIRNWL